MLRNTQKPNQRKPMSVEAEPIDPTWLLKAVGLVVVAALICGYLTFCFLFYQGQWQLVLHPTRTKAAPQSIAGAPCELVHFDTDETGTPQLTGWWIPATPDGPYAHATILFLSGANGSLADSIPTLASLHNIGINVFAFDYRGYGQSAGTHPSQENMTHDADSVWRYLNTTRAIPAHQIIPYGTGVGASLAAHLSAAHPAMPAVILDAPQSDLLSAVQQDARTHLLPVRLLFHEHFPLTAPLTTLPTPKLLIYRAVTRPKAFQTAADPKLTVQLTNSSEAIYAQSVARFLDQYLVQPPPQLVSPPMSSQAPSATTSH